MYGKQKTKDACLDNRLLTKKESNKNVPIFASYYKVPHKLWWNVSSYNAWRKEMRVKLCAFTKIASVMSVYIT